MARRRGMDLKVLSIANAQLAEKAQKAVTPTAGHIATLDANGDLADAGFGTTIGANANLYNKSAAGIITGFYVNSITGALVANANMELSDYVPVANGDAVQFLAFPSKLGLTAAPRAALYNAAKEYVTYLNGSLPGGTQDTAVTAVASATVASATAAYVRINVQTAYRNTTMFVKGTYPVAYVGYGTWREFDGNVNATKNPLFRAGVDWDGDSLMQGTAAGDGLGSWAERIALRNQMSSRNLGIGGGTVTDEVYTTVSSPSWGSTTYYVLSGETYTAVTQATWNGTDQLYVKKHSVSANATNLRTDGYLVFGFGCNDADLLGSAIDGDPMPDRYGTYDLLDYTGPFDKTTYCGAVEYLWQEVVTNHKAAKPLYVIPPKMGVLSTGYGATVNNRRAYYETAIILCKKWGIPVLNLWDDCPLNPAIASHYTSGQSYYYLDGQHLLGAGYIYTLPMVEAKMKGL